MFKVVGHEAVEVATTERLVGECNSKSERESEAFVLGNSPPRHGFAEILLIVQLGAGRHGAVPEEATGQPFKDGARGTHGNIHITYIGIEVTVLVVFLLQFPDAASYSDIKEFLHSQREVALESLLLVVILPVEFAIEFDGSTTEGTIFEV